MEQNVIKYLNVLKHVHIRMFKKSRIKLFFFFFGTITAVGQGLPVSLVG